MFGALMMFVQDNVLLTLALVLGLLLAVFLLKAIMRVLIVALLITGFMYMYNTYTPDIENAGVELLKSVQGTAVESGINLLVSNSDSLVVKTTDDKKTLQTSGVTLEWVTGSDSATLAVRGVKTEVEVTDTLKRFIVSAEGV